MSDEKHWDKPSELVAKAWTDEAFKKRLMANPAEVLREEGFPTPPAGVQIRVVENTDTTRYLVLPSRPKSTDLQEDAQGFIQADLRTQQNLRIQSLRRAAIGAFAERSVCALWSPARVR